MDNLDYKIGGEFSDYVKMLDAWFLEKFEEFDKTSIDSPRWFALKDEISNMISSHLAYLNLTIKKAVKNG